MTEVSLLPYQYYDEDGNLVFERTDLGSTDDVDRNPFAGMQLRCTNCRPRRTRAYRKPDDPTTVCRCSKCGKKHATDSLETAI